MQTNWLITGCCLSNGNQQNQTVDQSAKNQDSLRNIQQTILNGEHA